MNYSILVLLTVIASNICYCDKESLDLDPYYKQQQRNEELESDSSHLGNSAKSAEKLWSLFHGYLDQNSNLNRTQLYACIVARIKQHNRDEIKSELKIFNSKTHDEQNIAFRVYFEKVYGVETLNDYLKRLETEIDSKMDELEMLFKLELNRWSYIVNGERRLPITNDILKSRLSQRQFYSFIYVNEFDMVRLNDAKFVFDFYDLNHDSIIDYSEYVEAVKVNNGHLLIDDHEEIIDKKTAKFTSKIDINGDKVVDLGEFCDWNQPSLDALTREQVDEILLKCDANKDGLLSKNEIQQNVDFFRIYDFTGFGEDFSEGTEEEEEAHDEL